MASSVRAVHVMVPLVELGAGCCRVGRRPLILTQTRSKNPLGIALRSKREKEARGVSGTRPVSKRTEVRKLHEAAVMLKLGRNEEEKCLKDKRQKDEGEMNILKKNEGIKCERRFRERASQGHCGSRRGVVIIIALLLLFL